MERCNIKQRKVAVEYVKLCGYGHGGSRDQNGLLSLDEIAKQLGTSKTNLKRALSIERNLTDDIHDHIWYCSIPSNTCKNLCEVFSEF